MLRRFSWDALNVTNDTYALNVTNDTSCGAEKCYFQGERDGSAMNLCSASRGSAMVDRLLRLFSACGSHRRQSWVRT